MQNGDLIFEMRLKYGMTQREVAYHLGIALTVYKLYEAGIRPMKIDELNRMSNLFHVSLNALLGILSAFVRKIKKCARKTLFVRVLKIAAD